MFAKLLNHLSKFQDDYGVVVFGVAITACTLAFFGVFYALLFY